MNQASAASPKKYARSPRFEAGETVRHHHRRARREIRAV
jgi:hypothetical protein